MLVGCDWCISILTVLARSCSLSGLLLYRFPAVFLDRGHPRFWNFISVIPVDVIRVKSYVNSFLDPSGVSVRVLINKLYLVPKRVIAGLVGVLRKGGGLVTGKSYIPVVFFDSLVHRSSCFPDVDFSTFTGNPVDHTILFSRVDRTVSLGRTKCDLSVVLDLKTVRMPCCSRQWQRGSDTP